jgi:hypothetical protein
MAHETIGQKKWIEYGLEDLRSLDQAYGLNAPELLKAGVSEADAVRVLEQAFGLDEIVTEVFFPTPLEDFNVNVLREYLTHIAEKRVDARERYAHFAIMTMQNPFEIWKVSYDGEDGAFSRFIFIGFFKGKNQLLVSVDVRDREILWNFMQQDKKSLNKHRHGELVYSVK